MPNDTNAYGIDNIDAVTQVPQETPAQPETFDLGDGKTLTREELLEQARKARVLEKEMTQTRQKLKDLERQVIPATPQAPTDLPPQAVGVNDLLQLRNYMKAEEKADRYAERMNDKYADDEDCQVTSEDLFKFMLDHNYSEPADAYNALRAEPLREHVRKSAASFTPKGVPGSANTINTVPEQIGSTDIKPEELTYANVDKNIMKVIQSMGE